MGKGLKALKDLMKDYYEMCQDLGNNDDQYQKCNLTSERAIIEKELKALELIKDLAKLYDVEFCDKNQTMSFKIGYHHNKFILETIIMAMAHFMM